ncbi:MAG TPA: BrnT family toxin [Acetobacteraceae bacterium]|nr:BrnT family toxin [Acetobacteraceae bacterium]
MSYGFEWDEAKRRANVAQHGVDFIDAALIFRNPVLEAEDRRGDYGEQRLRALGHVGGDFFMVVFTWRGNNRRIISAWKVDAYGKKRYQAILARGD